MAGNKLANTGSITKRITGRCIYQKSKISFRVNMEYFLRDYLDGRKSQRTKLATNGSIIENPCSTKYHNLVCSFTWTLLQPHSHIASHTISPTVLNKKVLNGKFRTGENLWKKREYLFHFLGLSKVLYVHSAGLPSASTSWRFLVYHDEK